MISIIITHSSYTDRMITQKMVGEVETKKVKKKSKWVKFALPSRVGVMDSSTTAPTDSGKSPSASHKRRFPFLRRFFGNMLSSCWPGKKKNSNTKAEASCSPAADRSFEEPPEVDLPAANQETEPVTLVQRIRISPSFDPSFTSSVGSFAEETQETKPIAESLRFLRPDMELLDLELYSSFVESDTFSDGSAVEQELASSDFSPAPADSGKSPKSSHKRRFPFLHGILGKIRSFWTSRLPAETPEVDLPAATQETEPVTLVQRIRISPSFDPSFTSSVGSFAQETQETKPIAESLQFLRPDMELLDLELFPSFEGSDISSDGSAVEQKLIEQAIMDSLGVLPMGNIQTSAPQWVSTLFGQQTETEQDRATLGDDAGQAALGLPNLGNTCYINSVLQCLLGVSRFQDEVLSLQEDLKNKAALLRTLSDLCLSRLGDSDSHLKEKLMGKIKGTIGSHYPQFQGNDQQDAHEFLIALLSILKEESETLERSWPTFTCPVVNVEFKLKREHTCDSCGFQKSLTEDTNYLSLVIGPHASLTDSLLQCLNASSIECACSHCPGTKASETLKFLSHPQVLVLLVMRFDVTSANTSKLRNQLEIPEELTLSCVEESRKQPVSVINSSEDLRRILRKTVTPPRPQEEAPALIDAQYRLTGVVSHLGSNLLRGHYISHIRNPSEDGWLRCSDTFIRRTSWSEVSSDAETNGYLLFYAKRN